MKSAKDERGGKDGGREEKSRLSKLSYSVVWKRLITVSAVEHELIETGNARSQEGQQTAQSRETVGNISGRVTSERARCTCIGQSSAVMVLNSQHRIASLPRKLTVRQLTGSISLAVALSFPSLPNPDKYTAPDPDRDIPIAIIRATHRELEDHAQHARLSLLLPWPSCAFVQWHVFWR